MLKSTPLPVLSTSLISPLLPPLQTVFGDCRSAVKQHLTAVRNKDMNLFAAKVLAVLAVLAGLGNQYFRHQAEQSALSRLPRVAAYNGINFI